MTGRMARSKVRRQDQDPACDTSSTHWMLNAAGTNPCQLTENILRVCSPTTPPSLGAVQDGLDCPLSGSDCCCNIATYALLSACRVCQGRAQDPGQDKGQDHKIEDIVSKLIDYKGFLNGCLQNVSSFAPDTEQQMQTLQIPSWATITPPELSVQWDFKAAEDTANKDIANTQQSVAPSSTPSGPSTEITSPTTPPASTASSDPASTPTVLASSKSSTSPGTIAAAVLGALALTTLLSFGAWFLWRWRRRWMSSPRPGAKVDLTEPEMHQRPSRAIDLTSGEASPIPRSSPFPFPYEGVFPRYHPDAPHSIEPSRTDEEAAVASRPSRDVARRHTAPTPLSPSEEPVVDQFDRDLAFLKGVVANPPRPPAWRQGEGEGQVHHKPKTRRRRASITTFTQSDNSGSGSSRRARRKSGTDGAAKGQYYHLPPSAQYLADVARYPENVDPERPWNIRRQDGPS